jgi:hypothetical protein
LRRPAGSDEQCELGLLGDKFPPFADISVADFVARARLRSDMELHLRDECLRSTRKGEMRASDNRPPLAL